MNEIKNYLKENDITQLEFARKLGFKSQGAISQWFIRGRISYDKVLEVEQITGISRSKLRPDLYPPD